MPEMRTFNFSNLFDRYFDESFTNADNMGALTPSIDVFLKALWNPERTDIATEPHATPDMLASRWSRVFEAKPIDTEVLS